MHSKLPGTVKNALHTLEPVTVLPQFLVGSRASPPDWTGPSPHIFVVHSHRIRLNVLHCRRTRHETLCRYACLQRARDGTRCCRACARGAAADRTAVRRRRFKRWLARNPAGTGFGEAAGQGFLAAAKYGKGRSSPARRSGSDWDFVIIQDADLEYDPEEYPSLLKPLLENKADVVYGSRFLGGAPHRVLYFWHSVGNWILTLLSNCLTNINLSDMETCYKVFRREIIQSIPIEEDRFGFEPEITVKIAKRHLR